VRDKSNYYFVAFVALANAYIQAINDGKVPVIPTLWQGVSEVENQKGIFFI
jgi:hypothetical protein